MFDTTKSTPTLYICQHENGRKFNLNNFKFVVDKGNLLPDNHPIETKCFNRRKIMLTQRDIDYGFDENDVEELMDSFYEELYRVDQNKDYEDKE